MYRTALTLTLAGLATATLLTGCGAARQNATDLLGADTPAVTSGETTSTCPDYLDLVDGMADPIILASC